MAGSKATTVKDYLAGLPAERRAALEQVRKVILENLDKNLEEGPLYGMIGYYVPHRIFPAGYHCDPKTPLPFAVLGAKKNYLALHLMGLYANEAQAAWFKAEWAKRGKKLDMGKACVRIKKVKDVPLDVIGQHFARIPAKSYIEGYEKVLKGAAAKKKKK